MSESEQQAYAFGDYVINVASRELLANGREVQVQHRVFDLLVYLIENRDRAVSKDELLEQVWAGRITTDAALARVIMKARKAVGDNASAQEVIKTLHGHGYRFVALVKSEASSAESIVNEAGSLAGDPVGRGSRSALFERLASRRVTRIFLVSLVLALGYMAIDKYMLDPSRDEELVEETAQQVRKDALVESYGDKSIAVLPFVNMSADPEQEYFSDGISEELANLLTKIPGLRVISRSSAFSYKGKDVTLPKIAEQLNVAHILEGSVRKDAGRVRITAQLIEARSDTHLWSETYDREFSDVFKIQNDIAGSVVRELKLVIFGAQPKAVEIDPEAYASYLRGHHFLRLRGEENLEKSVNAFRKAVELEPEYALAWVGLSYAIQAQTSFSLRDVEEGTKSSREALQQALSLDNSLPEAHVRLSGFKATRELDWSGAFESFRKAESLDPDHPLVLSCKADLAEFTGQFSLGIELRRRILLTDPLNALQRAYLAYTLKRTGQLDEAELENRLARELDPQLWRHHRNMGTTFLLMGQLEEALHEFEKESQLRFNLHGRAMALYSLGLKAESDAALDALINKQAKGFDSSFQIAEVYAWRDEPEQAFYWLEEAREQDSTWLPFILRSVFLFNLEDDPRWEPFLETIGLSSRQRAMLSFD